MVTNQPAGNQPTTSLHLLLRRTRPLKGAIREFIRTLYSQTGHDGPADRLGNFVRVLAYKAMPVNNLPAVDYPVIQVNCAYPGATPETMANNVATPLERQFTQIPAWKWSPPPAARAKARLSCSST